MGTTLFDESERLPSVFQSVKGVKPPTCLHTLRDRFDQVIYAAVSGSLGTDTNIDSAPIFTLL